MVTRLRPEDLDLKYIAERKRSTTMLNGKE